jgi:phosphatidylserine/phosphatidylglycerophosphate/cardiolipin synthase-like enzyme
MDRTAIGEFLAASLADRKLSGSERDALRGWLAEHVRDGQQRGVVRHAAFDLARNAVADPDAAHVIEWLEDVIKAIVPNEPPAGNPSEDTAYFSPSDACLQRIIHRFHSVRRTADLCVFTITDDRISRSILDAHHRGVKLRIISDEAKAGDLGSDLKQFAESGIAVKLVRAVSRTDPHADGHMHHKFAIFDGLRLINGSYNWTRGAANINYENLIDTADSGLIRHFADEFEKLWRM